MRTRLSGGRLALEDREAPAGAAEEGVPRRRAVSAARSRGASDRLFAEAEAQRQRRAEAQRKRVAEETAAYSFRPSINPDSREVLAATAHLYKPIEARVADLQRAKEENVHRLRMEQLLEDENLTFRPRINEKSEVVARQRSQEAGLKTVSERLAFEAEVAQQRRAAREREWAEREARRHSFAPRINPRSEKLVEGGFEERQERAKEVAKHKRAELERRVAEAEHCTFQPAIGNAEQVLAHTRPALVTESAEERYERLASRDKVTIDTVRAAMQEEYYRQFSFEPELNPVSRRIGRTRTVAEHASDLERQRARERAALALEHERSKECTFQPRLETDPDRVLEHATHPVFRLNPTDTEGMGDRIRGVLEERERRKEAARREAEYEALKECPFIPETHAGKPVAEPEGPVVVRGLGRHLELRDLALQLAEERARREEEAFKVKGPAAAKPAGAPTVPAPFRLAGERRARDPRKVDRRSKSEREAREAVMGECTFQPRTAEGVQRRVVDALLSEADDGGRSGAGSERESERGVGRAGGGGGRTRGGREGKRADDEEDEGEEEWVRGRGDEGGARRRR